MLYEHQEAAIEKLSNGKILWGGVGTGKTITALAYAVKKETNRDIYVITTARKRDEKDWEGDAAYLRANGTNVTIKAVDSWNNIAKHQGISGALFILDEQRLVGSGSWVKSFLKIAKQNHWILLSATPGDSWMDYVPVFVANGFYANKTEFQREHVVFASWSKFPKIERYLGTQKLARLRAEVLVEMPFDRETMRTHIPVEVEYDVELFNRVWKDRWHVYESRPLRDVGEMFLVARTVTNSHKSRVEAVRRILQEHPRLIVFYSFDYELEALRVLSEEVTVAEWNGHFHQPVPDCESWVYLVQYMAGSEAWNCVATDTIVFYSQTYSYKQDEQAQGRIDRLNTKYRVLKYYRLKSKSPLDLAIGKSLARKEDFQPKRSSDLPIF